jgi:hypothetical protein
MAPQDELQRALTQISALVFKAKPNVKFKDFAELVFTECDLFWDLEG